MTGGCWCGDASCRYSAEPEPEGLTRGVLVFLLCVVAVALAALLVTG